METIQIKVKQGTLEGENSNECLIFRGVPYAEAPVGQLRFSEPREKREWGGVREALSFGSQCPQADPTSGFYGKEFYTSKEYPLPAMSEDCLYLNIWAPAGMKDCPVALWIHGGAFDHGFSSEMEFDGRKFAANGVILVSINYRVGVFGFFAHEKLRRENMHHTTGNYCLQDQLMALKWVKENISAFGGDSQNVTIFGQSAGAMSVQALVSSPLIKGMIQGAVMQSGGGIDNGICRTKNLEEAYRLSDRIMSLCHAHTIDDMRKVPAKKFVEILPELYKDVQDLAFGPIIDGYVLKEGTQESIRTGNVEDIPYMIGANGDDMLVNKGEDGMHAKLFKGCESFAEARNAHSDKPVYVYYFNRKLPGDDAGAFHSSELWYVFGTLERCWRPMEKRDYVLSDRMISAWASFMKDKDPGEGWKKYEDEEKFVREFD